MIRTPRTSAHFGNTSLVLCFMAACLLEGIPAAAQEPAGTRSTIAGAWVGEAEGPDGTFRVDLRLEHGDEGWEGSLTIPGSGSFEGDAIEVTDDRVWMSGLEGQFVLEVRDANGTLTGSLDVRGTELSTRFFRSDTPEADALTESFQREAEALRAAHSLELVDEGEALGRVNPSALESLVDAAEKSLTTSLVVLRHGELVGEWHAGSQRQRVESMSVTKVSLNLAIGRLLTLGKLDSLDTPVHEFFPEWSNGDHAGITVRHLLNHTSGLPPGVPTTEIYQAADVVKHALGLPLADEPGTILRYNNNATNLLAGVVGRVAGSPIDEFLRDDLFGILGITDFGWMRDPAGNPHGMAGLRIHARDLARLGQLALDRGRWNGEELIDDGWFEESFRRGAPGVEGGDMFEGRSHEVGLIWFLIRDDLEEEGDARGEVVGVMHSGDLGQWLIVFPEEGLVGVRMIGYSPAFNFETDAFFEFRGLLRDLVAVPEG